MVNPTYPGVYVTEVPSGGHAIPGVKTSVAAFLGRASKGPRNKAVRLCGFADYRRVFGPPHPSSDLAYAVQQFFDSGGRDCHVVRLAPSARLDDAVFQAGMQALDAVDVFNLMIIPADRDVPPARHELLWGPASAYCERRRALLLIDASPDWTTSKRKPNVKAARVNALRERVIRKNSAVFYPRIAGGTGRARRWIGPAGMIAGVIARTDASRGVWRAPVGLETDLRGSDLEVKLTDRELGALIRLRVNALRRSGDGPLTWGARTLAGSDEEVSEWKYINVRRLALFLEQSIYRGTQWAVFEPNNEPTWARLRVSINAFMMDLFRQGAFVGSKPDEAFYVKCDAATTTRNDRECGRLNIEVGFAPLKPAEFVVIRVGLSS